jgi:hypothetical protein
LWKCSGKFPGYVCFPVCGGLTRAVISMRSLRGVGPWRSLTIVSIGRLGRLSEANLGFAWGIKYYYRVRGRKGGGECKRWGLWWEMCDLWFVEFAHIYLSLLCDSLICKFIAVFLKWIFSFQQLS